MSGSNGGFPPRESFSCDEYEDETPINSPNYLFLDAVDVDDILSLSISGNSIIVIDSEGRTLGSITPDNVSRLKKCIEDGFDYEVLVIEKDGGRCVVRIYAI